MNSSAEQDPSPTKYTPSPAPRIASVLLRRLARLHGSEGDGPSPAASLCRSPDLSREGEARAVEWMEHRCVLLLLAEPALLHDLPVCFPGRPCKEFTPVGADIINLTSTLTPASGAIEIGFLDRAGPDRAPGSSPGESHSSSWATRPPPRSTAASAPSRSSTGPTPGPSGLWSDPGQRSASPAARRSRSESPGSPRSA
jgi:hypothetical protein